MQPYVPYGWQKKDKPQGQFTRKQKNRLNVFGLMSLSGQLSIYYSEANLDSAFIKNSLDDFAGKPHEKPYVIVLDNGPIHHSGLVKGEFEKWEELGMSIFYLPIYSPHLNGSGHRPIEILWRFVKYKWLTKVAYKTWSSLKKAILAIFRQYGTTYSINFSAFTINSTADIVQFNSA